MRARPEEVRVRSEQRLAGLDLGPLWPTPVVGQRRDRQEEDEKEESLIDPKILKDFHERIDLYDAKTVKRLALATKRSFQHDFEEAQVWARYELQAHRARFHRIAKRTFCYSLIRTCVGPHN